MGNRKTSTTALNVLSFILLSVILVCQIAMCFQAYYSTLYEVMQTIQFYFIFILGLCVRFVPDNEVLFFTIAVLIAALIFIVGYVLVIIGKKKWYYLFSAMCAIDAILFLVTYNVDTYKYFVLTVAFKIVAGIIFFITARIASKTPKNSIAPCEEGENENIT